MGSLAMKVVLAVDGSECSRRAVEIARQMKCDENSEFHVISVVDFFEPFPFLEDEKKKQIASAKELVANTVAEVQSSQPNIKVSGDVLDGYVKQEILKVANDISADLIILGSHGRTGVAGFLLGSVSRAILHDAHCAVRIVRLHEKEATEAQSNVLIAMDESDYSKHALEHVLASSFPSGTKFRCITVLPEAGKSEEAQTKAKMWLQEGVNRLNDKFGADSASLVVLDGEPKIKILDAAREWPAGLIVMGSHGRKFMERLMLGSVAEAVAGNSPCSVEVAKMSEKKPAKAHIIV
jgi:nucleotide-binding universal stress UspA family protein